ncbi:MAG TPA: TolC family protein [Candidatus Saccharimonadales bacterium]|jgi:outer membrane protein TolC|nr:TolC family protein [Candidatus Saccharimonadales bacterium]
MRLTTAFFLVLLCLSAAFGGQAPGTNGPVRLMSLADCLRSALEKNLSLQIGDKVSLGETVADLDVTSGGRLGLETVRLDAHQSYSYYDPRLLATIGQNFNSIPPSYNDLIGLGLPPREVWHESFESHLTGSLPTGARYDLGASGDRLSGTKFTVDTNGFITSQNIPFQYTGGTAVSVTQPLLRDFWIDSGRLNIRLSKKTVIMSELRLRLLVMDITRRVAQGYFDLVAARDQIRVQQQALELAQQLVAENKKKVEVGTMAPLDEKQAESQAAKAKADLTTANYAVQKAENVLKALITHDFGEIQPATIEPTDKMLALYQSFSLPECWRNGLDKRPDYLLEKESIEFQNIVLTYRHNQLFPGLDIVGTYGRNALGGTSEEWTDSMQDNRYPRYGGAVVLSLPLTFRQERDAYKKAKVAKEALILSLKRREDVILAEIDDGLKAVISTYATTESTREARVYAEAALDAEQKKLEQGKSTSFNVLQLQKDLTAASSKEIQALADYNKALHQLYFNEGTALERNKITFDVK